MNLRFWHRALLSRLGREKRTNGPGLLARLRRDEEGSYLVYMTLAIPVFIGFAGFASEGSLLLYNHRSIQSAADSAAYSAAQTYSNGTTANAALKTQAQAIVASYGFVVNTSPGPVNDEVEVTVFDPSTTPSLNNYGGVPGVKAIQVNLSRPQLPMLSSLWQKNLFNVGGHAIAIISGGTPGGAPSGGGSGNCLLALGNTSTGNNAPDSIHVNGGGHAVNINVPGCGVYTDSTDCTNGSFSVELGGNAKVNAGSLGSAGCIDVFGSANVTLSDGNYTQHGGVVTDPYAGTTVPTTSSAGSCTATTSVGTTKKQGVGVVQGTGTLCPGVYSNGITVTGGITVTLQPGIYILDGSSAKNSPTPFQVGPGGGGNTVIGDGVTLVFTSADGTYPSTMMNIDSLSNVTLSAPTTGLTDGFVMMGGSGMPLGTSFTTAANATASMTGTMYLPNAALTWHGTPATGGDQCLRAVVNTILLSGDSGFSNAGCDDLFGPGSGGGGGGGGGPPPLSRVTLVN